MYIEKTIKQFTRFLIMLLLIFNASYSYGAPAGYSQYIVPGDETSMAIIFDEAANDRILGNIGGITDSMYSAVGITSWTDNTQIYIDHWEDGYTFDPDDPVDTADEVCPVQSAGAFLRLVSQDVPSVPAERPTPPGNVCKNTSNPCNTPNTGSYCYYDARDIIYIAGGSATLTRVIMPEQVCRDMNGDGACTVGIDDTTNLITPTPGALDDGQAATVEALAWEIYPVRPQLTTYILPFGEDLFATGLLDFERVFTLIQATEDNTTIQVDFDGNGTWDPVDLNRDGDCIDPGETGGFTLDIADSIFLNRNSDGNGGAGCGSATALNTKTIIKGTATLQVHYMVANAEYIYDIRGYAAFPRGLWDDEYYAPVDGDTGGNDTDIYVHNPWGASININYQTSTGSGTFTVPANSTVSFQGQTGSYVPSGTSIYLKNTGGEPFWAVSSIDTEEPGGTYNWGYTLIPAYLLDDEYFVGYGPGSVPVGGDIDASGLFLAPVQDNTVVIVDYDADGPRAPVTYTLNRLQTQFIYDPVDGDLAGASIMATGNFTAAFGENPDTAPAGSPGLDAGYSALPGRVDWIDLVLKVDKITDPVIIGIGTGETTKYTITVNTGEFDVEDLRVTDALATGWAFCTTTTTPACAAPVITFPDGSTSNDSPSVIGQNLTWDSTRFTGGQVDMAPNQTLIIEYYAYTTAAHTAGSVTTSQVKATVERTVGVPAVTQTFTATDTVFNLYSTADLTVTKSSNVTTAAYPGDMITYTVTVTNTGAVALTNLSIYDPLPAGVTYVTSNVRDEFGSASYTINNGTLNWNAGWQDSQGDGPSAGDIQITAGQLRLTGTRNIYRQVNLIGTANPILTFSYSTSGNVDNPDTAYVEIATSAAGPWTTVLTFVNDATGSVTYPIPNTLISATTTIRVRTNNYNTTEPEYFYVDNMNISIVHNPPILLDGSAGYTLGVGQSVSILYRVMVDDPLSTVIDEITNTASVTSAQTPVPVEASVNDPVINPSSASSSVGDFIWLDIDGDATWDVGEPGIANVEVTLKDSFGAPLLTSSTTTTDSQGRYLFTGITPGTGYYVEITGGLPAGLQQSVPAGRTDDRTNSFDLIVSEGNNLDQFSARAYTNTNGSVTWSNAWTETDAAGGGATLGNVRVTNPAAELRITGGTSAIARSLNIPVATMATLNFNWRTTGIETNDTIVLEISSNGTTYTTLETFTNLSAISSGTRSIDISDYLTAATSIRFRVTAGYTDTANDYFFVDNVNIEYSSVLTDYLDADLAYKPSTGTALFGDLVWSDPNGNSIRDAGEPGLAGITVQLWEDLDNDGIIDNPGDTLVQTTTTGAGGSYLFSVVLSGTHNYIVRVDPSHAVFSAYNITTPASFAFSGVTAGAVNLTADFGFLQQASGTTYSITDRIWFDSDGDGSLDGGEPGISGVTVALLDDSGNVIGGTTTTSNGTIQFTGVPAGVRYSWMVTDNAGILADYYGTTSYALAGTFQMPGTLTGNLDYTAAPHFGYNMTRSIGDTVFNDNGAGGGTIGDGTQNGTEPGISGVTVLLYLDDGDSVFEPGTGAGRDGAPVSSMVTDANGKYLFTGLANGTYWVSIDNTQSALTGFDTLTTADSSGVAGHQRSVTVSGGVSQLGIDYGYRASTTYSVSGTIWDDDDADGTIDGTEALFQNVSIELLNSSGVVIQTVFTNSSGVYTFAGLPGLTVGQNYTARITDTAGILIDYTTTFEKTEGTTSPFNGQETITDLTSNPTDVKFGYKKPKPTLISLSDFRAYAEDGRVRVEWITSSEINTAGFFLFRLDESTGRYGQINRRLLPALLNSNQGGTYSLIDNGASLEKGTTYVLVEIESRGSRNAYGPFTVTAGGSNAVQSQYPSGPKAAGALLGSFDRTKGSQPNKITRYVDREGTLVITNSNSKYSRDTGNTVTDEVSDYRQTLKAVSAEKTTRLSLRKATKAQGRLLRSQRQGPTVKIAIEKDGLYYISSAEISRLTGMSQHTVKQLIKTAGLALSNQGSDVAYLPSADNSGLYFYGQGTDSIYTKENSYWLYKGRGTRMGYTTDGGPASVEGLTFSDTVHAEENYFLAAYPFMDPEADFWFWDRIVGGYPGYDTKTFTVETKGAAGTPSTATLTVNLQGFTDTPANPDHRVQVSVNGTVIDTVIENDDQWNGTEKKSSSFTFSQSLLNNGPNTIAVKGLRTEAPWSLFYVNSFDLTYQRLYEAVDNALLLKGEVNPTVTVQGFNGPDILVFDVTDPVRPALRTATAIELYDGKYRSSFVPASPESVYLAITADAATTITEAWADSPSNLKNRNNRADYILIAPDELIAGAQELAAYRQTKGLKPMVINVEDIMDEFNYGLSSPKAIQAFLTYAYNNWTRPPKYVVLAGDSTYDYRNYLNHNENLVPTMVVKTPDGLFTSDNVLADVNADHVPEIAIGRLPVLSAEELHNVTAKIIAYESTAGNHIVMLADNPDNGGNFPIDSNDLAAIIPSTYQVKKIYLSASTVPPAYTITDARQMLFSEITSGTSIISYMGHASSDNLADENLLGISDMSSLSNSRPFVLSAMTCMVGQYAFPGADSLSETLMLKKDGGASAVWAPSGLAFNSNSKLLAEQFLRTALKKRGMLLGSSILDSFRNFYSQGGPSYVLDIYNLQGDPALKLW